jgi:hypothetical protein
MRSLRFLTPSRKEATLSTWPMRCSTENVGAAGGWGGWRVSGRGTIRVNAGRGQSGKEQVGRTSLRCIAPAACAASHLQHAQHRLVGAAVQGAIQRAHRAGHNCTNAHTTQQTASAFGFITHLKSTVQRLQATSPTHPCRHPPQMTPGAALPRCCRGAGHSAAIYKGGRSCPNMQQTNSRASRSYQTTLVPTGWSSQAQPLTCS